MWHIYCYYLGPGLHPWPIIMSSVTNMQAWRFIILEDSWFPGKITITPMKDVLTKFKTNQNEAQWFYTAEYMFCRLFGMWWNCCTITVDILFPVEAGSTTQWKWNAVYYCKSEFCLVIKLKYFDNVDTNRLEKTPSHLKNRYFGTLKVVMHEDVRETFLLASDIPDENVSMLDALYFITSYLYRNITRRLLNTSCSY